MITNALPPFYGSPWNIIVNIELYVTARVARLQLENKGQSGPLIQQ